MADEWYDILQHEFVADEGSFLLELRGNHWDKAAFSRLVAAMFACCKAYDLSQQSSETRAAGHFQRSVPRWLAEGFWFVYTTTKDYTSHPAWRERIAREPEYYDKAYERLFLLGDWFFTGHCAFFDPDIEFAPM